MHLSCKRGALRRRRRPVEKTAGRFLVQAAATTHPNDDCPAHSVENARGVFGIYYLANNKMMTAVHASEIASDPKHPSRLLKKSTADPSRQRAYRTRESLRPPIFARPRLSRKPTVNKVT